MPANTDDLLTAEEFAHLEGLERPAELVRGVVRSKDWGTPRHGQVCGNVAGLLGAFLRDQPLGHLVTNNSAIVTRRSPDSVRGADVAVYLFSTTPAGPFPQRYLSIVPDLVFEVRSPSDRSSDLLAKVAEYLAAGVKAVCVLEPDDSRLLVYTEHGPVRQFVAADRFALPDLLGEFAVEVSEFFA